MTMTLMGKHHPVVAIEPKAAGAALAGAIISMAKTNHVAILVTVSQGNAAPVDLTLHQAKDVAGAESKPLGKPVQIYLNADAVASDEIIRQADGVAFSTDATLAVKQVVFEVPVEALDFDNGFTSLQVQSGVSNAANLISATYVCCNQRYHGASVIVD